MSRFPSNNSAPEQLECSFMLGERTYSYPPSPMHYYSQEEDYPDKQTMDDNQITNKTISGGKRKECEKPIQLRENNNLSQKKKVRPYVRKPIQDVKTRGKRWKKEETSKFLSALEEMGELKHTKGYLKKIKEKLEIERNEIQMKTHLQKYKEKVCKQLELGKLIFEYYQNNLFQDISINHVLETIDNDIKEIKTNVNKFKLPYFK